MRRRVVTLSVVLFAVVAGGTTNACSALTSFDNFTGADPECPRRRVFPPAPARSSTGSGSSFVGVTQNIYFTARNNDPILGYDLDGICTDPNPASCRATPKTADSPAGTGADNRIGSLLQVFLGNNENAIPSQIRTGNHGLLISVDDYNQTANDDQVIVRLYNVVGIKNGPTDLNKNFGPQAAFDVDVEDAVDDRVPLRSRYFDEAAYVRDGVLYAELNKPFDLRLIVPRAGTVLENNVFARVSVPLHGARLAASIATNKDGGLTLTAATLMGRIPANRVLQEVSHFGLCRPMAEGFKGDVCGARDIMSEASEDNTNAACDSISVAFRILVDPARIGSPAARKPYALPCGDEQPATCDVAQ